MMTRTKAQATQQAKAMLRKMRSKGWRVQVHENLGWHYRLVLGSIQLFESDHRRGHYWTLCDERIPPVGGVPRWTDNRHFKDPNKAVAHQLKAMQAHVDHLTHVLTLNQKLVAKK